MNLVHELYICGFVLFCSRRIYDFFGNIFCILLCKLVIYFEENWLKISFR